MWVPSVRMPSLSRNGVVAAMGYAKQSGISQEEAVKMLVNGFVREVLKELPMEFDVEAQKLVAISLEGSVG